ncbi:site-2 protease family protein [Deinococcus metallilatus]|uniref:Site-2 protease family protein n=2 Tax=Deinococcus TaxID=1298 RepID=A0AAJ5F3X2_9DEIO|nr:site-2 protease family protein [Deinococcus metallilatus]MBB5295869.1 Zn-dependent protease [Deinococcus metallilatus]QBY08290.1 site-2 protease family protein [Deinococcus metallilatus]RXJ12021.1 site-2 protease family protein [Deinococcus metallilatus]TLK25747.1 site-2 protease family protein [Deinococcus metallilatus]GMA14599.1 site-2 protease family protein [Deinococcus metallilatus]
MRPNSLFGNPNLIFLILIVLLALSSRQGLINLVFTNPVAFVIIAVALAFSLTVHEFAHAWTADRLGDPTPRRYGRVTLNPLRHLDPFGTLLLLLIGFGFARPVPINPNNLGRWGTFWVAAAGPISNLLLAFVTAVLLRVLPPSQITDLVLLYVLSINVVLAVFNLIPIPLLDGSRILGALVPSLGRSLAQFEAQPYSFLIVMAFIYLARGPIGTLIGNVQNWVLGTVGIGL